MINRAEYTKKQEMKNLFFQGLYIRHRRLKDFNVIPFECSTEKFMIQHKG